MTSVRDHLDRLYTLTLQTDTEREFYMAAYQYCALVMKNTTLSRILETDGEKYRKEHSEIWAKKSLTDEEADVKEDMTYRLERFSMYCDFSSLMMRIYYPLDDYIGSAGPESEQDPVAIVMMRGLKQAMTYKKWSKKTLESFNRWFEGKRSQYETDLQKFHLKMLTALWNQDATEQVPARPRPRISFNERTGDFYLYGAQGNFNPKSQEAKVFAVLLNAPDYIAPYLDLIQAMRPSADQASKSQKDDLAKVINSIKNALGEQRDIIQNSRGVGYRLVFPTPEEN